MTIMLEEETGDCRRLDFDYRSLIERAAKSVLGSQGFPMEVQLSVILTDEEHIHEINRNFRNVDSVTDVLSFPMLEYDGEGFGYEHIKGSTPIKDYDTDEILLGDIVLCVPRVFSQAGEYGHSVLREFSFLMVHSLLHLSGYDHMEEAGAEIMEKQQKIIMEDLGITR